MRESAFTLLLCSLVTAAGAECMSLNADTSKAATLSQCGASEQPALQVVQPDLGAFTKTAARDSGMSALPAPAATLAKHDPEPDRDGAAALFAALALMAGIGLRRFRR
jgi:hypothetical protein